MAVTNNEYLTQKTHRQKDSQTELNTKAKNLYKEKRAGETIERKLISSFFELI